MTMQYLNDRIDQLERQLTEETNFCKQQIVNNARSIAGIKKSVRATDYLIYVICFVMGFILGSIIMT